ncbi:SprT-like N-terminal [Pitangus sulphuratus]|nr:SprT-like N-terminal [Pitangus sulphuratus]
MAEPVTGTEDGDFLLALKLQREWEEEDKAAAAEEAAAAAAAKRAGVPPCRASSRPLSVVDEAWELLDPSPDVHALFVHFNQTLFWRKLEAVTVSWSPRMTRFIITFMMRSMCTASTGGDATAPVKTEDLTLGKTQMHGTQDLMPFSGMGYRLGGGDSVLSEKDTNASSSIGNSEAHGSQHHSPVRTRPIPKNEIKFEKLPRSGIFLLHTDDESEKNNLALKHEFPKPPVANTEDYENNSGLPARMARVRELKSNQGSANNKRALPSPDRPPKQICLEQTTTAQVASEKKSLECINTSQRWPKMEDKTAFEKYFIKKGGSDVTSSINTPMKTKAEFTQSSASSSNPVRQDKNVSFYVSCPVCEMEVLESKINEHLDSCLA